MQSKQYSHHSTGGVVTGTYGDCQPRTQPTSWPKSSFSHSRVFVWPDHDSTPQSPGGSGMKLKKIRVREFKSIVDSNEFDITDITCLVGKNEAGKTAVLQALYKLNPIIPEHAHFDVTEEYPRAHVDEYLRDLEQNRRDPAQVIEAYFALDEEEIAAVEKEFGPGCLRGAGHH